MARKHPELGSGELDVLKILWDRGPSTVREVMEILHSRGRRVAYTTVLTFLVRLDQKGVVVCDKSEHAHIYRAKVSRQQITLGRLRAMVRDLYDGAAAPMVLQLMSSEKFTPDELAQLQKLIEELDSDK
jgi:BlaI family penicillinase repressor